MPQDLDFKTLWQEVAEALDRRGPQNLFRDTNIEQRFPDIVQFLQELRQASNNKFQFDCSLDLKEGGRFPEENRTILVNTNLPGMYSRQAFTTLRLRERSYAHCDGDSINGIGYWSAQGLKRAVLEIAIETGFLGKSPTADCALSEPDPSPRLRRRKPTGDPGCAFVN